MYSENMMGIPTWKKERKIKKLRTIFCIKHKKMDCICHLTKSKFPIEISESGYGWNTSEVFSKTYIWESLFHDVPEKELIHEKDLSKDDIQIIENFGKDIIE